MKINRSKSFLPLCLLFICASILILNSKWRLEVPSHEADEYAWYYSSYYYHLYFVKSDFFSPEWKELDAIDHPPMAKYVFGSALQFADVLDTGSDQNILSVKDLDGKRFWHAHNENMRETGFFFQVNRENTPMQGLVVGRLVSAFFIMAAAAVFYFLLQSTFGASIAFLATLIFYGHILTIKLSMQMISDGIFLFFLMASVYLQHHLSQKFIMGGRGFVKWAALLGLVNAFSFLTKITGLLCLFFSLLTLSLLHFNRTRPIERKEWFLCIAVMSSFFLATVMALNPSLWFDSLEFVQKMLQHRLDRVELQKIFSFFSHMPNSYVKLATFLKFSLLQYDPFYFYLGCPLYLFGFIYAFLSGCKNFGRHKVVLINLFGWMAVTYMTFELAWPRYLFPALPMMSLIVANGLVLFAQDVSRTRPMWQRWLRLGVSTLGIFWVMHFIQMQSIDRYHMFHQAEFKKNKIIQLQFLQQRYPKDFQTLPEYWRLGRIQSLIGEENGFDATMGQVDLMIRNSP